MSLQLKFDEDFSEGIRRLILEECNSCLEYLKGNGTDNPHETIHELRKSFKKIRAALRLIRYNIDFYSEENVFFRDLGREISEIRDAQSNLETLEELYENYESYLYKNVFGPVEEGLLDYRRSLEKEVLKENEALSDIMLKLENKIEDIKEWPIDITEYDQISPGLKKVYKRGVEGHRKARKSGKVEDYHEWRKRVKYLRYLIDILNRTWPGYMDTLEDELHDISDWTGLDHDLHNLEETIHHKIRVSIESDRMRLLMSLISHQRGMMKDLAILKGNRFYRNSPEEFVEKIENFWNNHKREVESPYPTLPEELGVKA